MACPLLWTGQQGLGKLSCSRFAGPRLFSLASPGPLSVSNQEIWEKHVGKGSGGWDRLQRTENREQGGGNSSAPLTEQKKGKERPHRYKALKRCYVEWNHLIGPGKEIERGVERPRRTRIRIRANVVKMTEWQNSKKTEKIWVRLRGDQKNNKRHSAGEGGSGKGRDWEL